jgi:hypothetical protein
VKARWIVVAALILAPTRAAHAVPERAWFPRDLLFSQLLATPREVRLMVALLGVDRPRLDISGTDIETDLLVGVRQDILILTSEKHGSFAVGVELGTFTRLLVNGEDNELVNTDFRVGFPLSSRFGPLFLRLTPVHLSGHLGDDYLLRFKPRSADISRNGLEFTVAARFFKTFLRPYIGTDINLEYTQVEWVAGRWGLELEPLRPDGQTPAKWLFTALDMQITNRSTRLSGTIVVGLAISFEGLIFRPQLRGQWGTAQFGQLRTSRERFAGIALAVERVGP